MSITKILLIVAGLLLTSGGYLYYQNETLSSSKNEPLAISEAYQLEEAATPTPAPEQPTERALKASVGAFILMNDEQKQTYLNKFSESNDTKEAIVNLALFLDSDSSKLSEVENIIASAQTTQQDSYEYTSPSSNDYSYSYDFDDDYGNSSYNYTNNDWDSYSSNNSNYFNSGSTIGGNDDDDEINIVGGSSSYTQYGNTLYGSEGDTYTKYGNTVYGNDGSTYTQYGNTVYGNDGGTYTQYGNTVYGNDGTSYSTYGNTTYGSDGSTATQYGNTTYLDW